MKKIIIILTAILCSCSNDDSPIIPKVYFQDSGTVEHTIPYNEYELYIVIQAPIGTIYSLSTNGSWLYMQDSYGQAVVKKGQMSSTTQYEKLICNFPLPDNTYMPRKATIEARLSTGHIFLLELTQRRVYEDIAPVLEATPSALTFTGEGGTQTVVITADCGWTVDAPSLDGWADVSPMSGEGNGMLTVTTYESTTSHTGTISFMLQHEYYDNWGKADATVLVKQDKAQTP